MVPITASATISRPPEEVFDYLADVANLPEFCDHFTRDWRVTREDTWGKGAGVRFHVTARRERFSGHDLTTIDVTEPRRIVMAGRRGKYNRVRVLLSFDVVPEDGGRATRVDLSYETQPKTPSDRLTERRGFYKRGWGKALRRLQDVLEDGRGRGERISIAGGPRKPATGSPFRSGVSTRG